MELSEGIRRIGFRRWYERQLIESHLYLVSCFLCLVAVLACFEGFSLRAPQSIRSAGGASPTARWM